MKIVVDDSTIPPSVTIARQKGDAAAPDARRVAVILLQVALGALELPDGDPAFIPRPLPAGTTDLIVPAPGIILPSP